MKVVEEVFVSHAPIIWVVASGQRIGTTHAHPFYVSERGWVAAEVLRVGDRLRGHDGQWVAVEGVEDHGEWATVYNLRVADHHTYFVGSEEWGFSVWSHNLNGGCFECDNIPNSTFANVGNPGARPAILEALNQIFNVVPRVQPDRDLNPHTFRNNHGRLPPGVYIQYNVPAPADTGVRRLYYDRSTNIWYYSGNSHDRAEGSTEDGSGALFENVTAAVHGQYPGYPVLWPAAGR